MQLHGVIEDIRAKGAELVAIGSGNAEQAKWFIEADDIEFPVFIDTKLRSYQAANLARSRRAVFGLRPAAGGLRRMLRGNSNRGVKGDVWQQGGVMVIHPTDGILFAHRNEHLEDMADLDQVLAAL